MAEREYPNSGILFKNDRKREPNQPDRTGSGTIDGVEYWIDGWLKNGAKGQFLSLAFKAKNGNSGGPQSKEKQEQPDDAEGF